MDWSQHALPPMRLEPRFGDRVVPAFVERPASLWAMIADAAARNGDGEALVCGETRSTWHEVVETSARVAAGFAKLGLSPGDRVAILLGNRIEFVLTMFAAAHAGLVTVLLSTRQQKPEIAYVLNDCGAEDAWSTRLRWPIASPTPLIFPASRIASRSATSQRVAIRRAARQCRGRDTGGGEEEDTAMILYTSGTTGRPKGAMLAHCNIIHSSTMFVSCLEADAAPIARSPRCRSRMSPARSPTSRPWRAAPAR